MFFRKNPLFRQDIEPRCIYCARASVLEGETLLCRKKGVVNAGASCRSFRYDPTRRTPPRPAAIRGAFTDDDFSLEGLE